MLTVNHVKKSFGQLQVLKDINLEVKKGQVVAIIGSSGSGKSTFLRSIIDLEQVDGGDIIIEGEYLCKNGVYPSKKEKRAILHKTGMVFQHFNLFPHLDVQQNLMLAPMLQKNGTKEEIAKQAEEMLKKVGLLDKLHEMPNNLSGGQKQRVAIARALMQKPDLMLFDEPTSALDPELTGEVLQVIKDLSVDHNITMMVVTHEIGFAKEVADKIVFFDNGNVLACGSPSEIIDNSNNERIKSFLTKVL